MVEAKGNGEFFAIDGRAFALACGEGLNAAAAYLVLARGTGGDNRTTSWSAKAIHERVGIARPRAGVAIRGLETAGLVWRDPTRKPDHPRYRMVPAHEVPGCGGQRQVVPPELHPVLKAMGSEWVTPPRQSTSSAQWGSRTPRSDMERLVALGHAEQHADRDRPRFRVQPFDAEAFAKPQWIWLPNSIVDGAASEVPPLAFLHQTGDVNILRMFVCLYAAQNLAADGGLHFRTIRKKFAREKVGQQGTNVVWAFKPENTAVWPHIAAFGAHYWPKHPGGPLQPEQAAAFWAGWNELRSLGLIEEVAHLITNDSDDGEIHHPLPVNGMGLEVERDLAEAAEAAAYTLITEGQAAWAVEQGLIGLVPVPAHMAKVQLVGIYRLKYRPRTTLTQEFMQREAEWSALAARFRAMAAPTSARHRA